MKINDVVLNSFWMSNMDKYLRKFKYDAFASLLKMAQNFYSNDLFMLYKNAKK